jgi:membrane protein DedA with SNARE-associated domain
MLAVLVKPEQVQAWVAHGGYVVLFFLLFSCGLGVPIPEDIPLLAAGILIGTGKMNLFIAALVAWCGIIGGDCVLYHIGKRFGLEITRVPFIGRHLTKARIERAERLFDKYGVLVVGVGRMFAGIRGAMVVAAGTIRYRFVTFIIADSLGAVVSGGLFLTFGYLLGNNIDTLEQKIKGIEGWVALGAAVGFVLFTAFLWWRHKRNIAADIAQDRKTMEDEGAAQKL